jgi:hypothetical protein
MSTSLGFRVSSSVTGLDVNSVFGNGHIGVVKGRRGAYRSCEGAPGGISEL